MAQPYVGEIRMFGGNFPPNGWMFCDGNLLPISENETLFQLIGTTYGGDGVNTFATPNLTGRVPMHWGNGRGLTPRSPGDLGGFEGVVLTTTTMPTHGHTLNATTSAATSGTPGAALELGALAGDTMYVTDISGATSILSSPASTVANGGSQPHENTMPTLPVQYCIAYAGVYPQQS